MFINNQRPDEDKRRAYWSEQMEEAHELMSEVADCAVADSGEQMISLREAVDDAGIEVAFSDTKVVDNHDRIFFLRQGLIDKFLAVGKEMNDKGWVLRVEDAYRTTTIQKKLGRKDDVFGVILERIIWELAGQTPSPEFVLRRLSVLVATSPKLGTHMAGSALDISVFESGTGIEIDRGGPYLEMSELTPMASPFPSAAAQRNRRDITELLAKHGFVAYPYEFWHYSSGDSGAQCVNRIAQPVRYGPVHFDPATGAVAPVENPKSPLHTRAEILAMIDDVHKRSRVARQ